MVTDSNFRKIKRGNGVVKQECVVDLWVRVIDFPVLPFLVFQSELSTFSTRELPAAPSRRRSLQDALPYGSDRAASRRARPLLAL